MFVDEAKIYVCGGKGGNGCMSFRREKFVPRGGPDGGNGGNGGSVVMQADEALHTLLDLRYRTYNVADRGRHGKGKDMTGRRGDDRVIRVPLGTIAAPRKATPYCGISSRRASALSPHAAAGAAAATPASPPRSTARRGRPPRAVRGRNAGCGSS